MAYPADRMILSELAPDGYRALLRLDGESRKFGVEPALLELIKIRASQLNSCAFCLDMHLKDARAAGEDQVRLDVLAAWHETDLYSERERAALALTEEMTRLTTEHVSDVVYAAAAKVFSEQDLAGVILTITVINAWNRIGVSTRMHPGVYQPGEH